MAPLTNVNLLPDPLSKWEVLDKIKKSESFKDIEIGEIDFTDEIFSEDVNFSGSIFTGKAEFWGATFSGKAFFDGAKFSAESFFGDAKFLGEANFDEASFSGKSSFIGATFSGKSTFEKTKFSGESSFIGATFSGEANFHSITFSSETDFKDVKFKGVSHFNESAFSSYVSFSGATFLKATSFNEATFLSNSYFTAALFNRDAYFINATFSSHAYFTDATFSGHAYFRNTSFTGVIKFLRVKFKCKVDFHEAIFANEVDFSDSSFTDDVDFSFVTFKGNAKFFYTIFKNHTSFNRAIFYNEAIFQGNGQFSGKNLTANLVFSSEFDTDLRDVIFHNPENIRFNSVCFEKCLIMNKFSNLSEVGFYDIKWPVKSKKRIIYDEIYTDSTGKNYSYLKKIYSELVNNYEHKRNFDEAEDFYYREMEIKKSSKNIFFQKFSLLSFYKYLCIYGQNTWIAIIWLALFVFLIFPFFYLHTGIENKKSNVIIEYNFSKNIQFIFNQEFWEDYWNTIGHSMGVSTLKREKLYESISTSGDLLEGLQIVVISIQVALCIVTIRRTFRR